jgi:hypothetical protein
MGTMPALYARFDGMVQLEHARRVLVDLARVAKVAVLADVEKLCGDLDPMAAVDPAELKIVVQEGVVYFKEPGLSQRIDQEIAELAKVMAVKSQHH